MQLNIDNSFNYKFKGHLSSDSAAGTFILKGDTILLNYISNDLQSDLKKDPKNIALQLSTSDALIHRPELLLSKRKKLYLIDLRNKTLKTYSEKGKIKYAFMSRSK